MRVFAVDDNNDPYINNAGQIAINTELQATTQTCEHAVKTQLGELVLNEDTGVPTFSLIWNGSPNIPQATAALRTVLLSVTGVTDVTALDVVVKDNIFSYNATIQTIYGEAVINGGL